MGLVQGMLEGFSRSLEERQTGEARKQETQRGLQMKLLNTLLSSGNPELQRAAVSAMTELATKPGKRAKGLQGFLGGYEESNVLDPIMAMLQRMEGQQGEGGAPGAPGEAPSGLSAPPGGEGGGYVGQPIGTDAPETPAALPAASLVEARQGQPPTTTPPSIFTSEREKVAGIRGDIRQEDLAEETRQREQRRQDYGDLGATSDQILQMEHGLKPPPQEGRPQAGREMEVETEDGEIWSALVDPTDGRVIEYLRPIPPEEAKPGPRGIVVTTRQGVFIKDPSDRGRIGDAPERTPTDLPSYRIALATLASIERQAEAEMTNPYEWGMLSPAEKRERMDRLAQAQGTTMEELEWAASQRVDDPGSELTPPPGGDEFAGEDEPTPGDKILLKLEAGETLTPKELETLKRLYPGLGATQEREASRAASRRMIYPEGAIEREDILGLMRER